jgi:molecular chaperone DnaJ
VADDLYEVLGVARTATAEEIKKAYRRLARQHHPDATPDDPAAEARFKEVAHAYEVLSDPDRRQRYDTFGADGPGGDGGDPFGAGLGDIFDAFFGGGGGGFGGGGRRRAGPPRGPDQEIVLDLTFEQATFGADVPLELRLPVACTTCEATGAAPGTHPATCPTCDGAGQVRQVRQSLLGQMVTARPCPQCGGLGQVVESPCPDCHGEGRRVEERSTTLSVPPGLADGNVIRVRGHGPAGPRGGPPGDVLAHLRVAPHDRFTRLDDDLHLDLHVSPSQAALGVRVPIETFDGTEEVVVPRGAQPGLVVPFRGLGVPHPRGRGRGDLLVTLVVDVPRDLGEDEEALYRQLAELRGEEVAPPGSRLMSKIRSAFK